VHLLLNAAEREKGTGFSRFRRGTCENIHQLVDVQVPQPVLVPVFDEALGDIDHEDALSSRSICLIQYDAVCGDARALQQLERQADDGLDVTSLDEIHDGNSLLRIEIRMSGI